MARVWENLVVYGSFSVIPFRRWRAYGSCWWCACSFSLIPLEDGARVGASGGVHTCSFSLLLLEDRARLGAPGGVRAHSLFYFLEDGARVRASSGVHTCSFSLIPSRRWRAYGSSWWCSPFFILLENGARVGFLVMYVLILSYPF